MKLWVNSPFGLRPLLTQTPFGLEELLLNIISLFCGFYHLISRQSQSDKLSNRCNQLQEKLNMAISTLQQALAGINSQVAETVEKVID